jgi:hypothetical protein
MSARTVVRRSAAAVLVAATTFAATSWGGHRSHELDVAAVAITSPDHPTVDDEEVKVARLGGRSSTVQSDSTATSDCDGCDATSIAVTVAYVDGRRGARLDNVAHAWSSCTDCSSRTVSVQVVVLRRAAEVRAANRAFAANVACTGCTTTAVAYQLVVVGSRGKVFDRKDLAELTAWARDQVTAPVSAATLRGAAPTDSDEDRLAELEQQATRALGAVRTVQGDVDRSTAAP